MSNQTSYTFLPVESKNHVPGAFFGAVLEGLGDVPPKDANLPRRVKFARAPDLAPLAPCARVRARSALRPLSPGHPLRPPLDGPSIGAVVKSDQVIRHVGLGENPYGINTRHKPPWLRADG